MLTVNDPRSQSVGSGPIEKISLMIIEATRALTPDSRGIVTTNASVPKNTVQIKQDMWNFSSDKRNV